MTLDELAAIASRIRAEIGKVVVGQVDTVDLMVTALVTGGHMLLEGPPGTAKTLIAQAFAHTLDLKFGRIQFTPDLLPGDILGVSLFNFQTSTFEQRLGPIFCDILLADEINRTPPKVQAALLEAMQERQITLDGESRAMSPHFMVVATENPIEHQGVYPLPEAQLDRFLFKHILGYPSREEELDIVLSTGAAASADLTSLQKQADGETIRAMIACAANLRVSPEIADYVVSLVRATRSSPEISTGVSPRAGAHLLAASRSRAALDGRDYVLPDDVKALAGPAFRHRIVLSPAAEIEGRSADQALEAVIAGVEPPR